MAVKPKSILLPHVHLCPAKPHVLPFLSASHLELTGSIRFAVHRIRSV